MSKSSLPLHAVISEQLRRQIVAGDYLPSEKLPSEHQLMEAFQVSRITVRKAIANLASQGLVQAQRGKGVFVVPQQKVAYSLSSPLFLEADLARKGVQLSFESLTFETAVPPPDVQLLLGLSENQEAYRQKKLLRMNGAAGAVDISYLLLEFGQRWGALLEHRMTFPTLEAHGVTITRIDAVIECMPADYEMADCLEVSLGQPLIVYRYTAYTAEQAIVQGETISRADRFCYSLSTKR